MIFRRYNKTKGSKNNADILKAFKTINTFTII